MRLKLTLQKRLKQTDNILHPNYWRMVLLNGEFRDLRENYMDFVKKNFTEDYLPIIVDKTENESVSTSINEGNVVVDWLKKKNNFSYLIFFEILIKKKNKNQKCTFFWAVGKWNLLLLLISNRSRFSNFSCMNYYVTGTSTWLLYTIFND